MFNFFQKKQRESLHDEFVKTIRPGLHYQVNTNRGVVNVFEACQHRAKERLIGLGYQLVAI